MTWLSRKRDRLPDDVQLQEIDELHYLATAVFTRREGKQWSQDRLAHEAGMTQAQIATIEAGHGNPTVRSLAKLAHALGCAVGDLFAADRGHPHDFGAGAAPASAVPWR